VAARKSPLRAVKATERKPRAKRPKTIVQAATDGTDLEVLSALELRIATAVQSPSCPMRDLASLSKRLMEIRAEITAIRNQEGDDEIGDAASTDDEAFDPKAI
jgi:hypothetical protein